MFKVAIIGGEECRNYEFFQMKCITMLRNKAKQGERIVIYSNGDSFVKKFSERFGIETVTVFCDWKRDGKDAIKVYCNTILSSVDALILFNNGKGNAEYFYTNAKRKNLQIRVVDITGV